MNDNTRRLIAHPELQWRGDIPFCPRYGDIYFSGDDGLAETREVFLAACRLPERFASKRHYHCIGELGFGSGLTVLALMQCWQQYRSDNDAALDMVSFDNRLLLPDQARRAHRAWPELASFSDRLLANWPPPIRGVHRLELGENFVLTLMLDEIERSLPECVARVDAWFLDGFSPARNPQMWDEKLFVQLARLSAPGARLGTWSAAGMVRRGLEAAGFVVRKRRGHGSKRDRLEAMAPGQSQPASPCPRKALIIGAGIAGAACARALHKHGCAVSILDAAGPGSGASGNDLALIAPRLDALDGDIARLMLGSFLAARRWLAAASPDYARPVEARHIANNAKMQKRFDRLAADPPLPADMLRIEGNEALLPAFLVRPRHLLDSWLADIEIIAGKGIEIGPGPTILTDRGDKLVADLVIIACGAGIHAILPDYPCQFTAGQVETLKHPDSGFGAIMNNRYALQWEQQLICGAGFERLAPGQPAKISAMARGENLQALYQLRPETEHSSFCRSRASTRVALPDRLPLVGAVPAHADCLIACCFGSRGFSFAPWVAECLAAMAFARVPPASSGLLRAVSPERFEKISANMSGL